MIGLPYNPPDHSDLLLPAATHHLRTDPCCNCTVQSAHLPGFAPPIPDYRFVHLSAKFKVALCLTSIGAHFYTAERKKSDKQYWVFGCHFGQQG